MSKIWVLSPSGILQANELDIIIDNIFDAATKRQVYKTISLIDNNKINIKRDEEECQRCEKVCQGVYNGI